MSFNYKNPLTPITVLGNLSVPRKSVLGTNFSILGTGGYMEVYTLNDLYYNIPTSTVGPIELSANTIPIQFSKGTGSVFSPDVLTLNSDNISSGRRRLGMLVYVIDEDQIYQFQIPNFESLWTGATNATGPGGNTVVFSEFGTTIKSNTPEGISFISGWTSNIIEDVSGGTSVTAAWKKLVTGGGTFTGGTVTGDTFFTNGLTATTFSASTYLGLPLDVFVTGGTYDNNTFTYTNNTGGTFDVLFNYVTGLTINGNLTVTGNTSLQGLTANTISAATYQNLPVTADTYVTGFTFSSNTLTIKQNNNQPDLPATITTVDLSSVLSAATFNIATSGSFSASTYLGLPIDVFVTGGTYTGTTIVFTNNTGGTFSVTGITGGGGGGGVSGDYLPLSGGTVTGATIFTSGLTANTAVFSSSTNNVVNIIGSGSTAPIFRVQGSQGELFAVTDSLTGSLFSVNDISGLPIFEVFSDNSILMGSYFAPSLQTTTRITANIGTTNIYSIPTSAYTGAFFDYTVNNTTSARSGNIMSIFSGSSVQFTETSTLDIGTTTGITLSVIISGGNAVLQASAATNSWTVKTIIRGI
jgi:hypothetical protein